MDNSGRMQSFGRKLKGWKKCPGILRLFEDAIVLPRRGHVHRIRSIRVDRRAGIMGVELDAAGLRQLSERYQLGQDRRLCQYPPTCIRGRTRQICVQPHPATRIIHRRLAGGLELKARDYSIRAFHCVLGVASLRLPPVLQRRQSICHANLSKILRDKGKEQTPIKISRSH